MSKKQSSIIWDQAHYKIYLFVGLKKPHINYLKKSIFFG